MILSSSASFTPRQCHRIFALQTPRLSLTRQSFFSHASNSLDLRRSVIPRPLSAIRSYTRKRGCRMTSGRPLGTSDLRCNPSYSTMSETHSSQESHDVLFSSPMSPSTDRFDWRLRANSRMPKKKLENAEVSIPPPRRQRLQGVQSDLVGGLYDAFQDYKTRFTKLLRYEEAEEAAALKHRLSTWGVERLVREGYCMTGLYAYWLDEVQFGKPVALFSLSPGVLLPDNKLETGTQVLLSRYDPLKEVPEVGSIIRRKDDSLHVCFPDKFDLSGSWRADLGIPNIMYERMRTAISHLAHDPHVFERASTSSQEFILEGTELQDVFLRSSIQRSESESVDDVAEVASSPDDLRWEDMGAFKHDQRIVSWAKRYMKPNPIKLGDDPPINLNTSQLRAMAAMIGRRISLIQGPPGTGKTKTIIETIKLLKVHFEVPQPILVCTFTNVAVDNLVEGLAKVGVKPLRVGSTGNIRPGLMQHSLGYKMQGHELYPSFNKVTEEMTSLAEDMRKLGERYRKKLKKLGKSESEERRNREMLKRHDVTVSKRQRTAIENMFEDLETKKLRMKSLWKKKYAIEQVILRDVVAEADVVCTTCITSASSTLNVVDFPVVFLDEASMSTEPASLIPIMKGSRHLALIGDHKQLPPVIISKQAKEGGLNLSLFERLTDEGRVHSVMLDTQYRMHPDIAHFPASEFYGLALQNGTVDEIGKAVAGLEPPFSTHLNHPNGKKGDRPSVIFVDHGGNESMKGRSRVNVMEAHLAVSVVEDLLLINEELGGRDIGIIAPYAAQITLIQRFLNSEPEYRERLKSVLGVTRAMELQHIEVKTVDGFEGREKEVIIFSTVRNNEHGHVGFLADKKRLNVGLTRAKRGLYVLGSISTLQGGIRNRGESLGRYASFMESSGRVIRVHGRKLLRVLYGNWDEMKGRL